MKLIDKDAVVTEILRRRKSIPKEEDDKRFRAVYGAEAFILTELLEYVDNLQVIDNEYIQTDAFIKKATSYIQQHWIWNTKMIEDFINYIKGK